MTREVASQDGRFAAVLRSEARKLRTVPSGPLLALALVVVTFLAVAIPIESGDVDPRRGEAETTIVGPRQTQDDRILEVLSAGGLAGLIAMVLAAVAVSGDARHGTLVQTLLVEPRRHRVVGAHVVLHLLLGLFLGCVAAAVIVATAPALLVQRHVALGLSDSTVAWILIGVAVHTSLYAGLGAAIGLLVPSQPAAVAVTLVGFGAVEPLVSAALGPLRTFTISGASDALLGLAGGGSAVVGAAVLTTWLLMAVASAAGSLSYREVR